MNTYDQAYFASHYLDVCRIAMLAAKIMASNGAEAYRIEDTAVRMLKTTGFSYTEAHSSVTGMMISLDDPSLDHEVTLVSRIENRTNDLSRISLTNDLSRHFVQGELSVEEAEKRLESIQKAAGYKEYLLIPCYGVASGFFTFMFGGWPLDALAACLIGLLVGVAVVLLKKIKMSEFVRLFMASLLLGIGFFVFFNLLKLGQHAGPILYGSIMPLVPGMLITVSIRDLLNGDYISGLARIIESFLIAISIAAGMTVVIHFVELGQGPYDLSTPASFISQTTFGGQALDVLFQILSSFVSSLAFIILFNAEKRHLIPCGICGALTWLICVVCQKLGTSLSMATFLAAMTASLLSFVLAQKLRSPVTVFFTGGILCLVPGAGMFRTMYYFIARDIENGVFALLLTLELSLLIAVALVVYTAFRRIFRHIIHR